MASPPPMSHPENESNKEQDKGDFENARLTRAQAKKRNITKFEFLPSPVLPKRRRLCASRPSALKSKETNNVTFERFLELTVPVADDKVDKFSDIQDLGFVPAEDIEPSVTEYCLGFETAKNPTCRGMCAINGYKETENLTEEENSLFEDTLDMMEEMHKRKSSNDAAKE